MRTVTPAFRAAVGQPDTQPVTKVTVAWPAGVVGAPTDLSSLFVSIAPQADLTTDAPAGTRLISGYPTRNATVVLAGMINGDPTQSTQYLFDPWSTSSPLYDFDWTGISGAKLTIEQGLKLRGVVAPETYVVMTGYVDNCSINRDTGEVTLALLDFRPKLSTVPSLPMMLATTVFDNAAPGLSSLPLLEYILAANGIYAAPQPRPGCVWYATMHQTLWSQVASPTSANFAASANISSAFPPAWVPGKWAGATAASCYILVTPTQTVSLNTGSVVAIEGWFESFGTDGVSLPLITSGGECVVGGVSDNNITLNIQQADLANHMAVWVDVIRSGVTVSTPHLISVTATGWHQVMARVTFTGATTATVALWLDGVLVTTNLVALGAFAANATRIECSANSVTPMDTWQVWADATGTATPAVFTPTAFLDASLNLMTATPNIQGVTDVWGLIQQLCDAEFATAGFDEDLNFRFVNRYNVPPVSGATVTSLTQIKALAHEVNEANRARAVTASCTPFAIQPLAVVWQASDVYVVPAKGSISFFVTLSGPTAFVPNGGAILGNGQLPPAQLGGVNSYRGNTRADGTGPDTDTMAMTVVQLDSQTCKVTLTNPANHATYMVSPSIYTDIPAGSASIWLIGYPVNGGANVAQGTTSVTVSSTYGTGLPALPLPDSPWRQDQDTVQTLCTDVLADLVVPRPVLTQFTIVGDSSLQLGDRVTAQDRGELASLGNPARPPAVLADDLILISIHPTISKDGGFVQDITARLVGRPRQWILGQPGRSELGSTTYI